MSETYKCAICKENNVPEGMTVGIGDVPVCFRHLKEPDLWTKIPSSPSTVKQLIELIIEKETPKPDKKLADMANINTTLKSENANLQREIKQLSDEKNKIIQNWESDKKSIEKLMKMRNLSQIEPVLLAIGDRMAGIDSSVKDGTEFTKNNSTALKSEITALSEEIQVLKSNFESKNNEGVDVILSHLKREINQALDASQATTKSEISKINEAVGKQAESNGAMLGELKAAIQNNNVSGRVDIITEKLEELKTNTNGLWDCLEDVVKELKSLKLKEVKEPEPIKIEVKPPAEVKPVEIKEIEQPEKDEIPKILTADEIEARKKAVYEAYSEPRTIPEVSKMTGINARSVDRSTKNFLKAGKIKAEGTKTEKYVHV